MSSFHITLCTSLFHTAYNSLPFCYIYCSHQYNYRYIHHLFRLISYINSFELFCIFTAIYLLCPRPRRGGRGIRQSSASVVRPSDVAYIGSNSKTKRPRNTKLCTGVPQVTCDSHTDFKVKRSKVNVRGGGI